MANSQTDKGTKNSARAEEVQARRLAMRVRTALVGSGSIRRARDNAGKRAWHAALALLSAQERSAAKALFREENASAGERLARRTAEQWSEDTRESLIESWLALPGAQCEHGLRMLKEPLHADVHRALRAARRHRAARERESETEALRAAIGEGADRVHRAACAKLSRSQMKRVGLITEEQDEAMAIRASAMALTAAARLIGVPKGRLDRWERAGLIGCSFRKRIHVGRMVEARFWTQRDAHRIRKRRPLLEAHDDVRRSRLRREQKTASDRDDDCA